MINTLIETDAINSQKMEKPKSRRRVAREFVLQGIYQWKVAGGSASFS